ncbi:MAG: O-acetyl-ADP-ribose deacetylase [Anaerolineales bacterium]|jgi:O-acetyl-ADP-ribose deacetylase (regulator of RNase III)
MDIRIQVFQGDITELAADAIVNAANEQLAGGGGVDGAIHRAAGPQLAQACRQIGGCPTGQARITPGFELAAQYVIHTVGPIWRGGGQGEAQLLASCYQQSLRLAKEHKLKHVAFPAISTGVYGYPVEAAAQVAVQAVANFLEEEPDIHQVDLVCFDQRTLNAFQNALQTLAE